MKLGALLFLLPALLMPEDRQAKPGKNLLPNGGFEKVKRGQPVGWDRVDGLTTFIVKDPVRKGWCLRADTDVYKWEYYERREQMKLPHPPPPQTKTPTRGNKYNTAGGITGVPFFSEFIRIDPGRPYKLTLEFMPGKVGLPGMRHEPKVFVKGYIVMTREVWDEKTKQAVKRAIDRVAFKEYKKLPAGAPGKWQSYSFCFFPGRRNPAIKRLKVMLFPFWPPGEFFFDNVHLEKMDIKTWEKENQLLRALEKRERDRKGKVQPGRGAGNTPSKRQRKRHAPTKT